MAITLVGDINQMMYRFSGAAPEVIGEQIEAIFPDLQTYFLGTNYRSTRRIVEASMRNIVHNYESAGGPYSSSILLNLSPRDDAPDGAPISFQMYDDPDSEADAVANEINFLIQSGTYSPDNFFVGSRTRNQLGYIENALNALSIPFINITGGSFWTSLHVRRLTDYLALAVDETNKDAFKTVCNIASAQNVSAWGKNKGQYCPTRYFGAAFLSACNESYTNVDTAARYNSKFRPGVEDLTWFVGGVQYILENDGHVAALREIVDNCLSRFILTDEGIAEGDEAEDGKLTDLETVISMASSFESAEAFLAHVNEMREIAARAAENKDWTGLVVLSTIHRLKGLERSVVFGIGCGEGIRKVGGKNKVELPAGLLPHTFSLIDPPQMGVLPSGGRSPIEDERCIFHVLISRAKDMVFLSAPATYQTMILRPSRFVREIGLA